MNKNGPIIIIEDDEDDQYLLEKVFHGLNYTNERIYFSDGHDALDYLTTTTEVPFLILSDINMPRLDGFALREKLHTDAALHIKCIPYLFFSTAVSQQMVIDAYSLSAQGFFVKPNTLAALEEIVKNIMDYWKQCAAPNDYQ